MQTKIIYLKPRTTFRTVLRSDTLWGTLCWAIRNIYGETSLLDFITKTPFVISSTFPYLENGENKTRFFPYPKVYKKPMVIDPELSFTEKLKKAAKRKRQKKASLWLTEVDFQKFIKGEGFEKSADEILPKQQSIVVTRNRIDRLKGGSLKIGETGQLFHIDEIYLEQMNAGLFFLAKGEDLTLLEGALRYLNHIGIGGDRSTGKGHFEISEPEDYPNIEEPKDAEYMTNLSLYYPDDKELVNFQSKDFTYQLEDRQGRLGFLSFKNVEKSALLFFSEGAVLPYLKQNTWGQNPIVDTKMKLDHSVYHYGHGFMIKMNPKFD